MFFVEVHRLNRLSISYGIANAGVGILVAGGSIRLDNDGIRVADSLSLQLDIFNLLDYRRRFILNLPKADAGVEWLSVSQKSSTVKVFGRWVW